MKKKNNSKHLRIIEGGLKTVKEAHKEFISAYGTKSRLMGCVWVVAKWRVLNCVETEEITQYFYIDCDEYGIEDYHCIEDHEKFKNRVMEVTTVNCMGSERVKLSFKDLVSLIYKYHKLTIERGHKLHKDYQGYKFILDMAASTFEDSKSMTNTWDSQEEQVEKAIFNRALKTDFSLVTNPENIYGIINYFFMRTFAKDLDIIKPLMADSVLININRDYNFQRGLTLLKNTITERQKDKYSQNFLCKSLIQSKNETFLIYSKVKVKNNKVVSLEKIDNLKISTDELALMIKKPEYIILYQLEREYLPLMELPLTTRIPFTEALYDNSYLYMAFKSNNDHVLNKDFDLANDIFGSYIVTLTNQIAICSPTLDGVNKLRENLLSTPLSKDLKELRSVYLEISASFGFINSDYFEFSEFLEDMEGEQNKY